MAALVTGGCGPLDEEQLLPGALAAGHAARPANSVSRRHPVALFGQSDERWRWDRLFERPGCNPMTKGGCAITVYTMLNSYYAPPDREARTPDEMNSCLAEGGYRNGCLLAWGGCMEAGMEYVGWGSATLRSMRAEIDAGRPVLARVRRANRSECHHYVLVTGYDPPGTSRRNFEIYDSIGDGLVRRLNAYAEVCHTQRFDGPVDSL